VIQIAPAIKDIYQHSYWNDCFDILETERIRDFCDGQESKPSSQQYDDGECFRKAEISWIGHTVETEFFVLPLLNVVRSLNERIYGFDITAMYELFQYSVYSVGDHYSAWHIDGDGSMNKDRAGLGTPRKLSLSLQLSRPEEYEGGELLIGTANKHETANKEFGSITIFPSFMTHTVTPVIKGKRRSLVAWVSGPSFR